jgi:WD40 repeat protein/class 3 adenylate cyclase
MTNPSSQHLPTGIVTFMFTDIEGSTKIAQAHPDQWERIRGRHYEIIGDAIKTNHGFVFQLVGDEFCSSFHNPVDALKAAVAAQRGLQSEPWDVVPIKVRMGIHTGAAQVGDLLDRTGYVGYAALAGVNRVMSAGHGGQILLSHSSAELARNELPADVSLLDMGEHRLKGLLAAEHLWQVNIEGLAHDFPPLKTLTSIPNSQAEQLASFVERDKGIAAGLEKLAAELPTRAPVLREKLKQLAEPLRPSEVQRTYKERYEALKEMNDLCIEVMDISFITLCTGEEPPKYDARCPFRGLESFRPEDSEFFFGRELLINKLVDKIREYPFLAVLGASGSGKSSLVMAGLIPALNSDYVVFRPGTEPHIRLEHALSSVGEGALVVVDQFEEVFTLTTNDVARREFLANLLDATKRYKVVITLRSDFLGEVAAYRALNDAVQNHLENVPPMDMDELYQAMAGQAGYTGLRFEADLGQQILNEVKGEPGAMPLLQHALWTLWNRRHGAWLKIDEYQNFGGVKQAIASTAESVYTACTEADRERMRDIFLRLTRLDTGIEGRDTRRRVPLNDLVLVGRDVSAATLLLDTLANARLIVKTLNQDKPEIEVAHEALIRYWERLRGWLNEDRDKLRLREGVSEAAKEWEKSNKDEMLLNHRGGRLDDALLLGGDARYGLTALEQDYLNACAALRSREQEARERRLALTLVATIVVALVILGFGLFGLIQRNEARAQARTALTRQLAAEAQSLLVTGGDQTVAVMLAVQSMHMEPSAEAAQVLQNNKLPHPLSNKIFNKNVNSVAFSPDNKYAASGSMDGTVLVWEPLTGKEIRKLQQDGSIDIIVFSPNGKYIATGGCQLSPDQKYCLKGFVQVIEILTGNKIAEAHYGSWVNSVAFSPDTKYIVSAGCDRQDAAGHFCTQGFTQVVEISTNKEYPKITFAGSISAAVFSKDGKYITLGGCGQGSEDKCTKGVAEVREVLTGTRISGIEHDNWALAVAFSSDGKYVVSGGCDDETYDGEFCYSGSAIIWDAMEGTKVAKLVHESQVTAVEFSFDNKYVVTGSYDNTVRVWDAVTGSEISRMKHSLYVNDVAFSPNAKYVVSGSSDGTARVWQISTHMEIARMSSGGWVSSVAFSPDGKYVISGGCEQEDKKSKCIQGAAYVWEANAGLETARMIHQNPVQSILFSPNGKYLASLTSGGSMYVWRALTGKKIFDKFTYTGKFITFSPNSDFIVLKGSDNIRIWETGAGKEVEINETLNYINSIEFSPDGKYIVLGGCDQECNRGIFQILEIATGMKIFNKSCGKEIWSVSFSPDGKYIVSGSCDEWNSADGYCSEGSARVYKIGTEKEVIRADYKGGVSFASFSPDGKYVASTGCDQRDDEHVCTRSSVRVQEVATKKEISHTYKNYPLPFSFSSNNKYLLFRECDQWNTDDDYCDPGSAHVIDISNGKEILNHDYEKGVNSAAFSPDNKYIAVGSREGIVSVWDVSSGKELYHEHYSGAVFQVDFSPDSKYVVAIIQDHTVRVIDVQQGKEVARVIHDGEVNSAAFSPDGKYVASAGNDGIVRVWIYRPEDLIAEACSHADRNLTRAEWTQYIGDILPYQAVCTNLPIEAESTPTP